MRRHAALAADVVFAAVLLTAAAVPVALQDTTASSGAGGSSSSGSGSGGGSGSSGGSGSDSGSGADSADDAPPSGEDGDGGEPNGAAPDDMPSPAASSPPPPAAGGEQPTSREELEASAAKAVGAAFETTIRALPPFVLFACLVGFVGGPDAYPPSVFSGKDVANDVAELCSMFDLRPLGSGSGSGLSSTPSSPDEVGLRITVEAPDRVVVEEVPADGTEQRLWVTLLAVALLVLLVLAVALALRRSRRTGP